MEEKNCLIIFVKNPLLGNVKTRLAEEIGDAGALAVYFNLLHHTLEITLQLNFKKVVYYSDYINSEDEWDNRVYNKALQKGDDLGIKMLNAFSEQFDSGFEKVCIVGSDIPELNEQIIKDAFKSLDDHDAVIGPAFDGGYYLLGMKQLIPELFAKKEWSSNTVFSSTIADFKHLKIKYRKLPTLSDIDTREDLVKAWPNFKWK